jgi:hypothetical protein
MATSTVVALANGLCVLRAGRKFLGRLPANGSVNFLLLFLKNEANFPFCSDQIPQQKKDYC